MDKIVRDGMVAVLYSPGYGAGWSTWESDANNCVFNPRLVLAVLGESGEDKEVVAAEEYPDAYHGGVEDLEVYWVPQGSRFQIDEYDGNESIHVIGSDYGYIA